MVKKLSILAILFITSLLFIQSTLASVYTTGIYEVEIYSETSVDYEHTYDAINDRLYVHPSDALFSVSSVYTFTGEARVLEIIDLLGDDLQTSFDDNIEYDYILDFTLYNKIQSTSATANVFELYSHIVFETDNGTYYYLIDPSDADSVKVGLELTFILDDDGGLNVHSDSYMTGIYVDDVEIFDLYSNNFTTFNIYFANLKPNENQYFEQTDYQSWMGYGEDNLHVLNDFTENYFINYLNDHILPYAVSQADAEAKTTKYINYIKNYGITLYLPSHYQLSLFAPVYYADGFDYWFDLPMGQRDFINIKITDLLLDGTVDFSDGIYYINGEVWGEDLVYNVDGDDYNFSIIDELDQLVPPIVGFRLLTNVITVQFDSRGGTPSSFTRQVVRYDSIDNPPVPTRTGYNFYGWSNTSTEPILLDWDESAFILSFPGREISSPFTVYAVYRVKTFTVNINPNDGYYNLQNDFWGTLTVRYNETVNDNVYGIDLDTSVYQGGYALDGWYTDQALTTPFNESTPITSNITIYAKWEQVSITPPSIDDNLRDLFTNWGYAEFAVLFIAIILLLFGLSATLGLPSLAYIIELILVLTVFIWLEWFSLWAIILIVLAVIYTFMIEIRR